MADQVTRLDPAASPDLKQELNARDEEILRLRDLLIAKDAELGSLKGQVAQLEAGTARLLNVVMRVRSLLPGFVWSTAGALLRRLGRQS
jgi:small-conductance mechanosensitive channel